MSAPGRLELITIESKALQGNRLDDPHIREIAVFLPSGYDDSTTAYPVIYLLPAHGRTNYYYVNWNQYDETMPERLNRLMATGEMPPTIVVLPDFWTRLGGSQFIDSPIGNYETHFIDEIIPAVDRQFRTLTQREHRAVMGHSSGGYGALYHAMHHPELFGAVAAKAPDLYFEFTALTSLARFQQQTEKHGGIAEFIEAIPSIHPKRGSFWEAIHTAMYAMAYAPNPESPLGFDLPIDPETGALNEYVWQRWLEFDLIRIINQSSAQEALRQMQVVFLEVGKFDEYQLQVGARLLHKKLEAAQIEHIYEEFLDGHSSTSYRFDTSLPLIAKAIRG